MPGMTGTEMLKESLRTNPDAVKIILTGYTDVEALIEAINCARVYRYVNKPWDPEKLKMTVKSAISERDAMIEQKHLLDGLVSLVQSHPWAFSSCSPSSNEELVEAEV
jgi:response regulator RpfG family c-di-GMP phosphodiesterase